MFNPFGCSQNTPMPEPVTIEPGKAVVVFFSWSSNGNTRMKQKMEKVRGMKRQPQDQL